MEKKGIEHDEAREYKTHEGLYKDKYRVFMSIAEQRRLVKLFCGAELPREACLEFAIELWNYAEQAEDGGLCEEHFSVFLSKGEGEKWTWNAGPSSQFHATTYFGHVLGRGEKRFDLPSETAQQDVIKMLAKAFPVA